MKITLTEQAIEWFENNFPLDEGESIRFFGKTYGQTEVHEGFSMGIQFDDFEAHDDILGSTTVNNRTYFTIKEDQWFFEGYDLEIGIDDQYKEPSYHFISQNPSQEDEKTDGVSSPSKK
ncbi:MAG TPA: iron-sulfur cluster biosynthesis protein [Atopostipes sp.]|nr:iron-sulfur cluster biosynthesis protein [Atopostipes sp.]